jgi:hypothetical protein
MTEQDLKELEQAEAKLGKAFKALEACRFDDVTDFTASRFREAEYVGCMMYLLHGYSGPRASALRKHQKEI